MIELSMSDYCCCRRLHSCCRWYYFLLLGVLDMHGCCVFFFFQAEDGIRDAQESRGLGDVYKRQGMDDLRMM